MKLPAKTRILGFDPALRCTGYGLLDSDGQRLHGLDCGVIRTRPKELLSECLRRLAGGVNELLDAYAPQQVAIEGGFFSRNAKTAMVLGCARGVIIAAVAARGIPIYEYAPRRVKQSVCGYGNADKQQVATIIAQLVGLAPEAIMADATDALAVALCHHYTCQTNQGIFQPKPI